MTALLVSLVMLAGTACSGEPAVEYPEWTTPFPKETPVREYPFVPMEARTESLGLERDLVITGGLGRELYRPSQLAVAADGTLFVLDAGNFRVVGIDPRGEALVEFGGQGQGPGQFQRPVGFGVAGDRVIVNDSRNNRLTEFAFDGSLLTDTQLDDRFNGVTFTDLGDDLMAVVVPGMPMGGKEPYEVDWMVGRFTHAADLVAPVVELPASIKAYFYTDELISLFQVPFSNPVVAIRADKLLYVTRGDQYQVLAIQQEGVPAWALRTSYRPLELTEARRDEIIADRRETAPDVVREAMATATFVWPSHYAALENIETDGHGNLYAFPYTYRPPSGDEDPPGPFAVDVYSPDGTPLFNGLATINAWDAAHGDHVFRIEDDPDTGELVVARYRIVANWY